MIKSDCSLAIWVLYESWLMGDNIMNDPIKDIELTYQYILLVKTLATLKVEWHRILCTKTEHSFWPFHLRPNSHLWIVTVQRHKLDICNQVTDQVLMFGYSDTVFKDWETIWGWEVKVKLDQCDQITDYGLEFCFRFGADGPGNDQELRTGEWPRIH